MLFTTATFTFLYLPLVLSGYFLLGRRSQDWAAAWLFAASLFFYGYWMPEFTLLLLGSIAANFGCGVAMQRSRASVGSRPLRALLTLGIVFNLGLLGWFKYANFFVENFNATFGLSLDVGRVVLPIGISFYTFTQIAFLVDTYQRKVGEARFVHYGLFVTYFPHLIAGPVLHHAQMMPQFADPAVYRPRAAHLYGGATIFAIGLFKKIVAADGIAPYANAVFGPVDHQGAWPAFEDAWLGAVAYTLQLYFDFSGYSDMAIGLSWMFNIRLPFNFDSPYKAANISDFWRRWHISLSTFLRDYLYVPLGGNRRGAMRRYLNLGTTMVLGGLWHGASWSFVLWGGLHGIYLMVNHGFRAMMAEQVLNRLSRSRLYVVLAWAVTMLAVVVAWVFFRAETLDGAVRMVSGMAGGHASTEPGLLLAKAGLQPTVGWVWCAVLGMAATLVPNSNVLGSSLLARLRGLPAWSAALGGAAVAAAILLVVLNAARETVSAFIYFNF